MNLRIYLIFLCYVYTNYPSRLSHNFYSSDKVFKSLYLLSLDIVIDSTSSRKSESYASTNQKWSPLEFKASINTM